ncbi:MAG TPA: ABC transporter permease [Syntrophorhabdaceae bacterium]|jgi:phospholipid/cholesterol/gamma-HCH transport system permease protein
MIENESGLELVQKDRKTLAVRLSGAWKLGNRLPSSAAIDSELEKNPGIGVIIFETEDLRGWDSALLTFLIKVANICDRKEKSLERDGLPEGVQRLLSLATAVPERKGLKNSVTMSLLAGLGSAAANFWGAFLGMMTFIGETALAFFKMITGKARFRRSDFFVTLQECGADALPIVSLISILVGLILAFVGSIQLKMFGAQIYIADLVGIAMTRAMGAIMTGIIMAGRTGASFAARIGTMQVNEEIDALRTAGISPMEFLVLPRIIALAVMMPLLTLYSDLMGILGGLIVSVAGFDISLTEYFNETRSSVNLTNILIGLFSSLVFGILIALAGCLRGMQCGRSASAVGDATTSAVVTGIVSIIVATAVITVICNFLGL